jgi:nucleotidyltransferase substrate binding protein (TIGR01987 family)
MTSRLSFRVLELAIAAVEQGLSDYDAHPEILTIRDGVIQRFEIAMDLAWKLLQRVLRETYEVEEIRTKKDIFREAAQVGLIADTAAWLAHYEARNQTSHVYDAAMAEQVFAHIPTFLPDARDLLNRLNHAP